MPCRRQTLRAGLSARAHRVRARIPHKAGIPGQDGATRPTAADTAAAACGMFHMECIRPSHPGTRRFKNGIFPPSGLSHPLPYNSMAAFFGFPDKKPSRFRSKIFGKPRESACAALDQGLPAHGGRRGYKADSRAALPKKRWIFDCFVCSPGLTGANVNRKLRRERPLRLFIL